MLRVLKSIYWGFKEVHAETVKRNSFDVQVEIKKQFADLIAINGLDPNRPRDWAAEHAHGQKFGYEGNSADIEVVYWQRSRFPALLTMMNLASLVLIGGHTRYANSAYNFFDRRAKRRNFKLHRKIVEELHPDLGLIWKVAMETGHTKVSVIENPTAWGIAIEKGKFPGQNIPRIAFQRQEPDWRENPEQLRQRLNRALVTQKSESTAAPT